MNRSRMLSRSLPHALIALAVLTGLGCSSTQKAGNAPVAGAPGAAQIAMFDKIKSLAGEWMMPGEDGTPIVASVFAVTANGSVVREIMFPGTQHEMTNVYHLDGPSLIATHYCAAGNQPRMRAMSMEKDGSISFTFDSVTNLATPTTEYMGNLTFKFLDANHVEQVWTSIVNGKNKSEHAVFSLTRKGA